MTKVKLKDLDVDFLLCRDLRHQWDDMVNIIEGTGSSRKLMRSTTCLRCDTTRHETISLTTFRVLKRSYDYPHCFLLTERTPFAQIREASIRLQLKALKQGKS